MSLTSRSLLQSRRTLLLRRLHNIPQPLRLSPTVALMAPGQNSLRRTKCIRNKLSQNNPNLNRPLIRHPRGRSNTVIYIFFYTPIQYLFLNKPLKKSSLHLLLVSSYQIKYLSHPLQRRLSQLAFQGFVIYVFLL